jgi:hypothetical protein
MPSIGYVHERHLTLLHSATLGMVQTIALWSTCYMAKHTSPRPGSCQRPSSCLCLHGIYTTFCPLSLHSRRRSCLLCARILLAVLHMWCLPPSATCRGISVTVTLILEQVLVWNLLSYDSNMLNINRNLKFWLKWYIPKCSFLTNVLHNFTKN